MKLYVGSFHVVSAEISVAVAVPIENPADCEVRGIISFLQANEILGYLAGEASSRVELRGSAHMWSMQSVRFLGKLSLYYESWSKFAS